MPVQDCIRDGKRGKRWGKSGKCYLGPNAKALAERQGQAIRASGYVENAGNPLRMDPTRTATLRRVALQRLRKRLARLRGLVRKLVVDQNVFGLGSGQSSAAFKRGEVSLDAVANTGSAGGFRAVTANVVWKPLYTQGQLGAFMAWYGPQMDAALGVAAGDDYWNWYIQEGYKKGAGRAFADTRALARAAGQDLEFYEGSRAEFLRSAFAQPEAIEKVKLLASRTLTDLKNVSQATATAIHRELMDGLVQGRNPRDIARSISRKIDSIGRVRAETIARTELIRAHAEGQLDAMEKLGVTQVGAMVEWSTAGDSLVCPLCADIDGIVLRLQEARMLIPRHPNCRCAWIPANVGEPPRGQIRDAGDITAAIDKSIMRETGAKTLTEAMHKSTWPGSSPGLHIARTRPTSVAYRITPKQLRRAAQRTLATLPPERRAAIPRRSARAARTEAKAARAKAARTEAKASRVKAPRKKGTPGEALRKELERQRLAAEKRIARLERKNREALKELKSKAQVTRAKRAQLDAIRKRTEEVKGAIREVELTGKQLATKIDRMHRDIRQMLEELNYGPPQDVMDDMVRWGDWIRKREAKIAAKQRELEALVRQDRKIRASLMQRSQQIAEESATVAEDSVVEAQTAQEALAAQQAKEAAREAERLAAKEAQRKAEKEAKRLAEKEAKRKAEKEALKKAEKEALRREAAAAKKAEEAAKAKVLEEEAKALEAAQAETAANLSKLEITPQTMGKANLNYIEGWSGGGHKSYGAVLFDDQGRILLREPKGHFDGYHWTFAKGGQEKGHSIFKTISKEVAEETGWKGNVVGAIEGGFKGGTSDVHMLIMRPKKYAAKWMDKETQATRWVTRKEAMELIQQGTNKLGVQRDLQILEAAYKEFDKLRKGIPSKSLLEAIEKGKKEFYAKVGTKIKETAQYKKAKALGEIVARESKDVPVTLPEIAQLERVGGLPGSTNPDLMKAPDGSLWVMKSVQKGLTPGHLRSEALADKLYRILGYDSPASGIVETAEGPSKVSQFLKGGVQLRDWIKTATEAEKAAMFAQIREGFVADSLLANHDVLGLNLDNILVVGKKAYRIDNGGALAYRAQGLPKRNFGATVRELETMLDKTLNPNTAMVFKGITDDEIDRQIAWIVSKRKQILDAVEDVKLRETLAARLDYLEGRITKRVKTLPSERTALARAEKRQAEPGISKDTAERVKRSRINGTTIKGDREDVEDLNILVWEEKDVNGKPVTKLQFKVTTEGSKKIQSRLPSDIARQAVPNSSAQSDPYWGTVLKGAKTVGYHAEDGAYNEATLAALDEKHKEIKQQLKNLRKLSLSEDGKAQKAMLEYYDDAIEQIQMAKTLGEPPPKISQYIAPKRPSTAQAPKASPGGVEALRAERVPLEFRQANLERGFAKAQPTTTNAAGHGRIDQLRIDPGDGAEIKFMPRSGSVQHRPGLVMEGNVEITIPGEATAETIKQAVQKAKALGVDLTPPSADYEELLYLHRSVYLRNDHKLPDYLAIWNDKQLSDADKVRKIQEWAEQKYGVNFASLKRHGLYNPEGKTMTSWGDGHRYWERWDLTPQEIARKMDKYTLAHWSSTSPDKFVDQLLNSGGELTSTAQRIRKGIPINRGMSPAADLETGGGSYTFTRIKTKNSARGARILFKIDRLGRQDVISYNSDNFGSVRNLANRHSTIEQYRAISRRGSNETLFKHGLSLLDDVDVIPVSSEQQRQKVLDVFRKHKISVLPDGRPIEKVVVLRDSI